MTTDLGVRILDAFPSGSYSLSALLRLMDIVETDAVPTAAIECRVQPRLLINPAFVERHAATPEKLLMLVMHELHHVLLGHTTLFPRPTPVHNFVFDAVINGVVCRMFPRPAYTAFFRDYYSPERFPECLLAPPPGWPGRRTRVAPGLKMVPVEVRWRAREVHSALYSKGGASYSEVYDLLPKLIAEIGQDPTGLVGSVPLLGEHGDEEQQQLEDGSPVLFDVVRGVVERWPQPPDPIRGRSMADILTEARVAAAPAPSNRALLRKLIRKIADVGAGGVLRVSLDERVEVPTPIPSLARRSLVLQALGQRPLLHPGTVTWRRRAPAGARVHVYLDVSGSMSGVLGPLYGAILDCAALVEPTVHLFSTQIVDISLAELRAGKCVGTGGTGIDCVAEHIAKHRVKRALLVTDGWVGVPTGRHHGTLARTHLAVAYLGGNTNEDDLRAVARHTCTLDSGASS